MERKIYESTPADIAEECCMLKIHGKNPDYADAYAKVYIEQNLISQLSRVFDNFKNTASSFTVRAHYKDMIQTRVMERINIHLKNMN